MILLYICLGNSSTTTIKCYLIMQVSFSDLKYLVTVVGQDLLSDDFGNFQDCGINGELSSGISDVSEEMYDKVHLLRDLLDELYKHRPLPF